MSTAAFPDYRRRVFKSYEIKAFFFLIVKKPPYTNYKFKTTSMSMTTATRRTKRSWC